MSIENKQDAAEPSPASAGSVASAGTLRDTFAAAALTGLLSSLPNGDQYHSFAAEKAWSLADAMLCERVRRRCPVSLQENLTLTDAEREAVESAIWDYEQNNDDEDCARMVSTLESLLERTK